MEILWYFTLYCPRPSTPPLMVLTLFVFLRDSKTNYPWSHQFQPVLKPIQNKSKHVYCLHYPRKGRKARGKLDGTLYGRPLDGLGTGRDSPVDVQPQYPTGHQQPVPSWKENLYLDLAFTVYILGLFEHPSSSTIFPLAQCKAYIHSQMQFCSYCKQPLIRF